MINKRVCYRCWEKAFAAGEETCQDQYKQDMENFEMVWNQDKQNNSKREIFKGVYCPAEFGGGWAVEQEPPPETCPRKLEHAMAVAMENKRAK